MGRYVKENSYVCHGNQAFISASDRVNGLSGQGK